MTRMFLKNIFDFQNDLERDLLKLDSEIYKVVGFTCR
jgi:hypothetical protein